jgi:hypothetical protein
MAEIRATKDNLFEEISHLIEEARQHVKKAVNTAMVYTYYNIGKHIVENEQNNNQRAAYGKKVLQQLSNKLTDRFGKGWSVETLTLTRKFYLTYAGPKIANTVYDFQKHSDDLPAFTLSWSHYLVLMRIENPDERSFYEIECHNQNWSVRQLQRQYNSSLYERLALSRDKKDVMRLAAEGQTIEERHTGGTDSAQRCQHLRLGLCTLSAQQRTAASQGEGMDRGV